MKYCKHCGILYSNILDVCPQCGMEIHKPWPDELPKATEREKKRQWLGLVIGIPAMIIFLYLVGWMFSKLMNY